SGEGSRCRSNDRGASDFNAALAQARALPAAEAKALRSARQALAPQCDSGATSPFASVAGISSASGRAFAAYLAATDAFYRGDHVAASRGYTALRRSAQPWLREAATYMVGRTLLNAAQVFDP